MEKIICKLTNKDLGLQEKEMFNPKIRIAARGIVIKENGEIAVFNKVNKNEYKLPGGGAEGKEDIKETFKREVIEETGCEIEILKKLGITEEYISNDNFKQISHVFIGKVVKNTHQFNFTKKETDEGAKLLWTTPEEALKLITECYDKLIPSVYEGVYRTQFVVLRDRKILEYYMMQK